MSGRKFFVPTVSAVTVSISISRIWSPYSPKNANFTMPKAPPLLAVRVDRAINILRYENQGNYNWLYRYGG